eukprot:5690656-Prymnesium_polylepis.1
MASGFFIPPWRSLRRSGPVPPPKRVHVRLVNKGCVCVSREGCSDGEYRFGNVASFARRTELPNASGSAGRPYRAGEGCVALH